MEILPFSSAPSQTFNAQLGTTKVAIAARYNETSGVWTMDVTRESDATLLVRSVPILIGEGLLAPYALGLGGDLIVSSTDGTGLDAGPEDFGADERVVVCWLTTAEIEALREAGAVL